MPPFAKNILIWAGILVGALLVVNLFQSNLSEPNNQARLSYSEFMDKVEAGEVADVVIRESKEEGSQIQGHFTNGEGFALQVMNDPNLVNVLRENKVKITAAPSNSGANSFLNMFLSSWLPFLLLIGVYIFFMRQMQGGKGGGAMGFGKSRARLLTEHGERVTFADVAGIDEAKEELSEIVDFLKNPQKFQKLGGKIPRGCLLVGPPGT
ncbi:MAG: ATP-dependent metallopeptidase FtsH/Yme1/Tma family protein, partial [Alphaproteobacteria bacterium]